MSRDRLAGLQRLSRRLAEAASVDGIVAAVFDVLETPVPTASRAVWLLDATAEGLELVAHVGLAPDAAARFAVIDLAAPLPGAIACRERRTIVVPPDGDAVAAFPALDGCRAAPRGSSPFRCAPSRPPSACWPSATPASSTTTTSCSSRRRLVRWRWRWLARC
ncbi:MAG: hypothetical protein R2690_00305 [Acidimicrobiales bacterium]